MCMYLLCNIGKKKGNSLKKRQIICIALSYGCLTSKCVIIKKKLIFFKYITIKNYKTCSIHIRLYNILYNFYQIHPWSVHDLLKLIIGNFYVMLWFLFNIMIQTIFKSNRGTKRLTTRWLFDNPCLYLKLLKHYVF